ncbi:unnamed protein product [Caenorhabditis nigoni]
MADQEDFIVERIGFYKRDNNMKITVGETSMPKTLNGNHEKFLNLKIPGGLEPETQCVHLADPEVKDDGNVENYLESLLNYISIQGFGKKNRKEEEPQGKKPQEGKPLDEMSPEEKPQFVTNRSLLAGIATKPGEDKVWIVQYDGVFFMVFNYNKYKTTSATETEKEDEKLSMQKRSFDASQNAFNYKFTSGSNFAHYLTKQSDDEKIPEDYAKSSCKAVMKCYIQLDGKEICVFYSAETDALEKDTGLNVELKSLTYGTDHYDFWMYKSCPYYWKLFFGSCRYVLVGDKTGRKVLRDPTDVQKIRNRCPEYSLCRIEELKIEDIHKKMQENKTTWEENKAKLEKNKAKWEKNVKEKKKKETWPEWTVVGGKDRVRRLLTNVKEQCLDSGVCYSGTEVQVEIRGKLKTIWNFVEVIDGHPGYDDAQVFVELVKDRMDGRKKEFPNL